MIDLKNLDKWAEWRAKTPMHLQSEKTRTVRLALLARTETVIELVDGKRRVFLAAVKGHETLQFVASGPVTLEASADCGVYTAEMEDTCFLLPGAVSFTRITERRHRNPELERMMQKMNQNMERRLRQAEMDMERRLSAERTKRHEHKSAAAGSAGKAVPGASGSEGAGPAGSSESEAAAGAASNASG